MLNSTIYSCVIIDANSEAINSLKNHLNQTKYLKLVASFNEIDKDCQCFFSERPVDIVFLTMHEHDFSNIDIFNQIKNNCEYLVIISTSKLCASDAFDLPIDQFIKKPYTFCQLEKKLSILLSSAKDNEIKFNRVPYENLLFVRCEHKHNFRQVDFESILYCEVDKNDAILHTDKEKYKIRISLNDLELSLGSRQFIRISRSYIVAIPKIKRVSGNEIQLLNGVLLAIGEKYKSKFFNLLESLVFSKL